MSRKRFLDSLTATGNTDGPQDRRIPATGPGTSIVSIELMEHLGIFFPEAHTDAEKMASLAEAGHTIYGFDVVMPLFSVWHESAALGCDVDWGRTDMMPDCTVALWQSDEDIVIPGDFLLRDGCAVPLEAIRLLKKRLGTDAAVCGKVFGPWTLGYHVFGVEEFLVGTLLEPDMIRRSMDKLIEVTITFARAQIDAGADCLLLGDHATRDLCSPDAYGSFLKDIHQRLAQEIPVPLILHICGDTSDRIGMIADTGFDCFHWDTKLGSASAARSLAGDRISLMGGITNPGVLASRGTGSLIEAQVIEAVEAGIEIIAPECAVSLGTPMENMRLIADTVRRYSRS